MITYFDKNSPGCECQLNSTIQRTGREKKDGRSKTSRSRRSQRIKSGENLK